MTIPLTCCVSSVQFSSVTQLCPTLCDPMDCTTPGLPVHYPLPESTQTHVHWVDGLNHRLNSTNIQPSHPVSSPSPPAFNVSQHQGLSVSGNHIKHYWQGSFQMSQLFVSGSQSTGVLATASVLPMNIQNWFPLGWTGWISLQSKGLSRVFSNTNSKASIFQCSTFFMVQLSHPYMTIGKTL